MIYINPIDSIVAIGFILLLESEYTYIGGLIMFKIGEFASINKVTVQALRYYDNLELLTPIKIDEATGYRYYSAKQINKLNRIIEYKKIGFSLKEIKYIFESNLNHEDLVRMFRLKEVETKQEIVNAKLRLSRIESSIKSINTEVKSMKYEVIVKETDELKVATLRDYISEYTNQGHLWEELVEHIEKYKVKIESPCMVIYHPSDNNQGLIDAEVIEPIKGSLPCTERIMVKTLKKEKVASITHIGSNTTLNNAYKALAEWIELNNKKICGPQRELYKVGEWITEDENQFVTEIQYPIIDR